MRARLPGTSPVIMAMLMAGGLYAPDAKAQSTESLYEPIGHHSGGDVHAVDETPSYVVPDFAPAKAADPNKELPFFKIRLGLSLIVAIGPQNAFVLRQGLTRRFYHRDFS